MKFSGGCFWASSRPMELRPGDKLGPYEIAFRIGEGGMGEVWKARDTRLGRDGRFLINTELESTFTEPIHLLLNWRPPK